MSEQNSTEMTFQIQRIYTKDISFEAPNAPQVFQKDWQPEVKLDLDTASSQLAEGVYEVVLRVTVTRWRTASAHTARTFCSRTRVSASPAWFLAVPSRN